MDDRWLKTVTLVERMNLEADGGRHYAVTRLDNGHLAFARHGPMPDGPEMMFLTDMALALSQIHHDGRWVVLLTHPVRKPGHVNGGSMEYRRRVFLWLDQDGDPGFSVENEEAWWRVLEAGMDNWLEQCEVAWQGWHKFMRQVLDPRPDELFKRAQGQKAPSETKH